MNSSNTYISEKLAVKLDQLRTSHITIVTAPAGYGKSTAVVAGLASIDRNHKHWFVADRTYSFYEDELYNWFLSEVSTFSTSTAEELKRIGLYNRSNRYEILRVLKTMEVSTPHYIALDNLHYIQDDFSKVLINAFIENTCENIHLIVLSQFIDMKQFPMLHNDAFFTIDVNDLSLRASDLLHYSNMLGVELSLDNAEKIYQYTEGWIVMISLCFYDAEVSLGTIEVADLDKLIYKNCWNNFTQSEQQFLLYFSQWQTLSERHVNLILDIDQDVPTKDHAIALFNRNPLIKYNSQSHEWVMHNVSYEYVKRQFLAVSNTVRKKIYKHAASIEHALGNERKAIALYFKVRDYESLLSCRNVNMLMTEFHGVAFWEIASDIVRSCPDELLKKYPLQALRYCYGLFAAAKFNEFHYFLKKMQEIIQMLHNPHLYGEWMILSAFDVFPDIKQMTEIYAKASTFLAHPSMLFYYEEPYMFGCTSMWYLFYSQAGKAEAYADDMDQMILIYNQITNGHGAGAEMLFRGEVYCVQGRFDEAEILAHTAARLAEANKNVSIIYGAALLLGIIAIYTNNMSALEESINYLEMNSSKYVFMQHTEINQYMIGTVRGYLLGLLMETQNSTCWARNWEFSSSSLTFTNFMVKTTQITDMILHKEYRKAIANIEASLTLDKRLISLPTQNFMHVGLTLCYLVIGNIKKATYNLEISLSLSEQDKNYTFLACFRRYLAPLMILPGIRNKHAKAIQEIKSLKMDYHIVKKKAIFDMLLHKDETHTTLSKRELEIAQMAATGMRNKEIANELNISEYTVKNHLSVIYQKLDVDRRSKLIEMLQ